MTLSDLTEFAEFLEQHPKGYVARTQQIYLRSVHAAMTFGGKNITKVLTAGDYSRGYMMVLRAALLLWAEYTGDKELEQQIREPKIAKRIARSDFGGSTRGPLLEDEYRRFLASLAKLRDKDPTWVWPSLSMACKLALRVGVDLCSGVRRKNVERAHGNTRITIWGKGDKTRELPATGIQAEITSLLGIREKWVALEDLVAPKAPQEKRADLAYQMFRRIVHEIAKNAGLDPKEVNTHRLRKSAAYLLYKGRDHDIDAVRRILGHTHVGTTQAYLGIDNLDEIGETMVRIAEDMES